MFIRLVLISALALAAFAQPDEETRQKVIACLEKRGLDPDHIDLTDPKLAEQFKKATDQCLKEAGNENTVITAMQNLAKRSFPEGCQQPDSAELTPAQKRQSKQDFANLFSGQDTCLALDSMTRVACLTSGNKFCGLTELALNYADYQYALYYLNQQANKGSFSCDNNTPTLNPDIYTENFDENAPILQSPVDCSQFENAWPSATTTPEWDPESSSPVWEK